jgi:hypothetical protein
MCSALFLVVVAVVVVVIMFICSCHYKYTSYTLVLFLCMSQWCYNNSHDLPQYVRQLMKWRDGVDGNKCRSIIIFFIPVTDTVYMCTCHYVLFPFLLMHAARFWISQYCDVQIGYSYCWSKSHCWYISLVLLIKRKYQIPSKTPKNISDSFPAFPWTLQTTAEIVPWILSVPLLSMSSQCHHSLLSCSQCYIVFSYWNY